MNLNWDLVRQLLLAVEGLGPGDTLEAGDVADRAPSPIANEHLRLLLESGFMDGSIGKKIPRCGGGKELYCYAKRLTWAGHQLLANMGRNTYAWKRLKHSLEERGRPLSQDAFRAAAMEGINDGGNEQ